MKDDAVTEDLIQHCSLADVLAFAVAREDVRDIASDSPLTPVPDTVREIHDTIPCVTIPRPE